MGWCKCSLAVASAVHGLSVCERQDLYINVLIAHTNTTQHPSSSIQWLADIADNLHGYDLTLEQLERLQQLELDNEFTTKAVQDYTHALTDCYHTQAEWIIVFEDDVLLAHGWFAKTKEAMQTIQSRVRYTQENWLFMRLFNQERSTGWKSRAVGGNHEVLISSLISFLTFTVISICRRRYGKLQKVLDRGSIFVTCVLAIPTFVVLFFQAGKASMLPPRDGVRKEAFGCCSQGLVFPRDKIPRITEYLTSREHGQVDLMLNDLAVEDSLDRFALYPVQLQHIGQRSVRGTTPDEAQAIWSMAFENLDPKALQSSHTRSLERLFPSGCTTDV
ncbi:hypothetical protein E4T48_03866 [Aureobasidium sp. EXF-10727]|nr:hypothetical protein E4T48_03866 [Aureobasidium sp. EXF-10727]